MSEPRRGLTPEQERRVYSARLRCYLCGRFMAESGELAFYQPWAEPTALEPREPELVHPECKA